MHVGTSGKRRYSQIWDVERVWAKGEKCSGGNGYQFIYLFGRAGRDGLRLMTFSERIRLFTLRGSSEKERERDGKRERRRKIETPINLSQSFSRRPGIILYTCVWNDLVLILIHTHAHTHTQTLTHTHTYSNIIYLHAFTHADGPHLRLRVSIRVCDENKSSKSQPRDRPTTRRGRCT